MLGRSRMTTNDQHAGTRHGGPIWTHDPSIGEQLGITIAWVAILVTLGALGILPTAPFGVGEWVATYGLTLLAAVPAFLLVELVHHRVFAEQPSRHR